MGPHPGGGQKQARAVGVGGGQEGVRGGGGGQAHARGGGGGGQAHTRGGGGCQARASSRCGGGGHVGEVAGVVDEGRGSPAGGEGGGARRRELGSRRLVGGREWEGEREKRTGSIP
jgi:hypothetical protein